MSATPDLKVVSSTFEDCDQEEVNLRIKPELKMVIKTYDKRELKKTLDEFNNRADVGEQTQLKTMRTTSTQQEENIKSKHRYLQ